MSKKTDEIAGAVVEGLTPVLNKIADALLTVKPPAHPNTVEIAPGVVTTTGTVRAETVAEPTEYRSVNPVPLEYVMLCRDVLNKDFGLDIEYSGDKPVFTLIVKVPQKYSNASEAHWATYHEDRRVKVIPLSDGVSGVRDYMQKIDIGFQKFLKK